MVVVSRGRPGPLALCLDALSRLRYAPYEIVVVADPAGLQAVAAAGLDGLVKTVAFDVPNISAARNAGIAAAAGEVVAFIDDDAVPEPCWLHHLAGGLALGGRRQAAMCGAATASRSSGGRAASTTLVCRCPCH
ncbi:glycosyltransferase family 2 protein [Pseudooceanicola sp. LIPI14-2-Ac024]|uniref:glycosyltransferase family 2 protein n=1 Tax=Pseudooceanicola sp. LIPI14-2-Ac024 TaxID=3344875 RepID=UPI0035CEF568